MDEKCICTALRQAAARSTAFYDAMLAPSGIKVTMFRLLRQIDGTRETSIFDLAATVGLDRSTLGRNLRVLEKQTLISMQAGQDERTRLIALTAKGRAALETALPLWRMAQDEFGVQIGHDITSLLDRITQLQTRTDPASGKQT